MEPICQLLFLLQGHKYYLPIHLYLSVLLYALSGTAVPTLVVFNAEF